jgi:hypothetical protein
MPREMREFNFPCGESSCMNEATEEFEIRTQDAEYKMPLCAIHAVRLARDARINRVRI